MKKEHENEFDSISDEFGKLFAKMSTVMDNIFSDIKYSKYIKMSGDTNTTIIDTDKDQYVRLIPGSPEETLKLIRNLLVDGHVTIKINKRP